MGDEMTLQAVKAELRGMAPAFAKRVAPVYQQLGWKWMHGDGPDNIPNEDEILTTLLELIQQLEDTYESVSTGGLTAYCDSKEYSFGLRIGLNEMGDWGKIIS